MVNRQRRITSTTDLGRWNAEVVLERLYGRAPRTNAELAGETGLSRSTVERALDLLVKQAMVSKSEPVTLVSGRPAALYELRPEYGHLLAIDVGANTVRARVDDLTGPGPDDVDAEPSQVTVDPEDKADVRLEALEHLADQALAGAGVAREQVRAVTVGTPGIVGRTGEVISCRVIRSGDWEGDGLRTRVSERFPGAVVAVENDANLAVLAEQRFGAAGDAADVVVVFAGRRLGFGIVHGGELHRGAHNQAGEAANIRDSSWGRANIWLRRHEHDARRVFAAAEAGQPEEVRAVGEFAGLLGMAFAEVVHTIDPELIVLGGALSLAGTTILDPVADRFERACRGPAAPRLALSTLGRRAVLLGAADHARHNAFAHLLDEARPHLPSTAPRSRQ